VPLDALPRPKSAIRWQHLIAWRGHGWMRLPALRLPSSFRGGLSFLAWHDSGANASRERDSIFLPTSPRKRREGARTGARRDWDDETSVETKIFTKN
ncbi:MAG: hypothetical protein J2P55_13970, partial [Rhizobiales bacterium]|nr:hypothetical protein [Hyphomicrobiales bacterium]